MIEKVIHSPLHWIGNKIYMISRYHIDQFIPIAKIHLRSPYIELFCGSGVMFFNLQPTTAYLNDMDGDLINFWRVVQKNSAGLEAELQYRWHGQHCNDDLLDREDDVGRAALFYCKNYNCFNKTRRLEKSWEKWAKLLDRSSISIEQRDAIEFMEQISNWKGLAPIVFADPPYYGTEQYYSSKSFDHVKFAEVLKQSSNCRIIMTYNDCPEIRELYAGWDMKVFPMYGGICKEENELVLSNRPLRRYVAQSSAYDAFIKKNAQVVS